jgi:hypothetical protein
MELIEAAEQLLFSRVRSAWRDVAKAKRRSIGMIFMDAPFVGRTWSTAQVPVAKANPGDKTKLLKKWLQAVRWLERALNQIR